MYRLRFALALIALLLPASAEAQKYVFLDKTSSSPWTLPADWPGWGYVACVGNGGNGSARISTTRGGNGGGGGEYAAEPQLVVTSNPAFVVRAGGSASTTTFTGASVTVTCHPGGLAANTAGSAGIAGTGSTNTIHFNGGAGRATPTSTASGGGGGAAGDLVGAGQTAPSNIGGVASDVNGDTASTAFLACTAGTAGFSGQEWQASPAKGAGYGACGFASGTNNGTTGGNFGGGGSGASTGSAGSTGGVGGDGQIFITYYPNNTGSIALAGVPGEASSGDASGSVTSLAPVIYLQYLYDTLVVSIIYCTDVNCSAAAVAITSVADTAGNTCSPATNAVNTGANGVGAAIYICPHTVGTGADTVTVSFASPVFFADAIVSEWIKTLSPEEVGNNATGSGTTMSVSTNGSISQSTDLVLSVGQATAGSTSNGQIPLSGAPTKIYFRVTFSEYQIATATGTTTNTWPGSSGAWTASIIALKPKICNLALMKVGC